MEIFIPHRYIRVTTIKTFLDHPRGDITINCYNLQIYYILNSRVIGNTFLAENTNMAFRGIRYESLMSDLYFFFL